MAKKPYEAPNVKIVGSLHDLTLAPQKFETHRPDGVLLQPPSGPPISLTS
jgi:hypothetical protein